MTCCQLHNHTEYSLLDGASKIDGLVSKAKEDGMPAIGISDHGNMFGVPQFVLSCRKHGIKPVIGCEFYIARNGRHDRTTSRRTTDEGLRQETTTYHQILFAMNEQGYHNLLKLTSLSYTEGYYYKPRIDRELLVQYNAGLIATTCCLASEIHQALIHVGEDEARKRFEWYLDLFGRERYFIELQRHGLNDQDKNNLTLIKWAKAYNLRMICTNDVHYVNHDDAEAHDLLLALQTGADLDDPDRFRFTDDARNLNPNFYFKTTDEMAKLFSDVPEAVENTVWLAEQCHYAPELSGELILPTYQIPPEFPDMLAYLKHLTLEGAQLKYGEISADLEARIEQELGIIGQMGYEGYFLIVQEFTAEARKRGVFVGPGRGSAAGSVVAYCTGIIDVDPMAYSLFFERFLNPERVSPPDIDIDFDDEGREQVINFVVEKYGKQSVSQIITYSTMGAKTAIRDVGRVMKVPLLDVNRIAKLVPERPNMNFEKALSTSDNPDHAEELNAAFEANDPQIRKMLEYARKLEGTPRQVGIHAAGVIIAPGEVSDYAPVAINNTRDQTVITQFDGPHAELAGLLKMDFLGLKTLSIIKTACRIVLETKGIVIDPDNIPLEDDKTFELYQKGETVATFQFESEGMRKHLRSLKPTTLEDLIAMNALYRPGPMDNIPSFVRRKHGEEPVEYPHELLEPILKNTYGIMVYQEQIMEAARTLAGYTLGGADLLRRAMGKKKVEVMNQERVKFVAGAAERAIEEAKANEIFDLMDKFAGYGFNKSHAAAYSILAFRTAYLKANYPEAYMAAVLSHNLSNIEKITFFMEECRRMGIAVLPPDVNDSQVNFTVNQAGNIRFGLAAIKGVGESAAEAIIRERENGPYESVFDLCARVDKLQLNKRTLESLAYAGAFDACSGEGVMREQFFAPYPSTEGKTLLDIAIQYGVRVQEEKNSNQASMFGSADGSGSSVAIPKLPPATPWSMLERLNHEREVIGFYISGHPLDRFQWEMETLTNTTLDSLNERNGQEVAVAGIVTAARERISRSGSKFGTFVLEDKTGSLEFTLFKQDYVDWKGSLEVNNQVLLKGRMEASYRDPSQFELKLMQVKLLDGLLEHEVRQVELRLPLARLQPALVDELSATLLAHAPAEKVSSANQVATATVRVIITGHSNPTPLRLRSRGLQVLPSHELLNDLRGLDLEARLLTKSS